jgi:phosphonate transport system permease protein
MANEIQLTTTTAPATTVPLAKPQPASSREDLLRPFPKITLRSILIALAVIGVMLWSIRGTRAEPATLIEGIPNMVDFVRRLFPIDFDWTAIAKLPIEMTVPVTINATKYTDTLDGDAELAAVTAALSEQVPLDELLASGQPMPESNLPPSTVATGEQAVAEAKPWVEMKPSTLNRLWVPGILPYVVETLQMAIVGTLLAVVLAIPFGLLGARNTSPNAAVYQGTRFIMNANRAIPELIFALIFVAAVGLGPFTGVLALAIASMGSLGRLYSEAIEQIDPQQVMAVRATGANRMQVFGYSVVPQVLPLVASYSLVYFEHNVRAATILGIVGAGGVGLALQKYIGLFEFRELMGAVIVLIVAVTIIDRISARIRAKLI